MSNLPKGWKDLKLGDICNFYLGLTYTPTYVDKGIPFLSVKDLKNNQISFENTKYISEEEFENSTSNAKPQKGDIVFGRVGTLGNPVIVDFDIPFCIFVSLGFIRVHDNIFNEFIKHWISSDYFMNQVDSQVSGSAQKNLNVGWLKNFKLFLPPLEEQKKIADILSTVDKKIAFVEENINATEELKKGLMQKLLTEGIGHTEFKDTKIGKVPSSWEVLKLVESISIMTDYVANGSFASLAENVNVYDEPNYAIYVRLFDLRKGLGHEAQKYVDEDSYKFLSKSNLVGNEILIANIGANVGEAFLMPIINKPATLAPNMIEIKVNIEKLISEFLYFYLTSNIGLSELEKVTEGSGQPKINKTKLKTINVPLPSLKEQSQIIEILSTVDKKIENLKEKKQSFEELKKGLMQKLLTGEVRV